MGVEVPDASGKSFWIGSVRMLENISIRTEKSWYCPAKQQADGTGVRNGKFDKTFKEIARGRESIVLELQSLGFLMVKRGARS